MSNPIAVIELNPHTVARVVPVVGEHGRLALEIVRHGEHPHVYVLDRKAASELSHALDAWVRSEAANDPLPKKASTEDAKPV